MKKQQRGITLITLVITIIVLLILAGISIAMLTGENGILTKASSASEQTKQQGAIEKVQIAVVGSYGHDGNINIEELKSNLNNVEGIDKSTIKESLPMLVTVDGIDIRISDLGNVSILEEQQVADGSWTGIVNSPKLASDMTAVYWDESGNEIEGDTSSNWYNYDENKWANAKTSDGSYWVWIPRYEYKILSGEGTSTAGEISVNFISKDTTKASQGYKIHPAFIDGTSNNYVNGEWDKELSGMWVMKFEASSSTPTVIDGGGNTTNLKMLSIPGVPSWRGITIGNSYTNAMNYDRSKESHMMKNSEWGAVAYLTQSKYGRNGTEVTINDNSLYYTGGGEGESYKTNTAQSTTGNTSGIYDMSGGAWERVAAYITNGHTNLNTYGESFANSLDSTKYATVYPYDSASDEQETNYTEYAKSKSTRYGDSILEISTSGTASTGWFGDYSYYSSVSYPFFVRGGNCSLGSAAGVFAFGAPNGNAYISHGFRACLDF